MCYRQVRSKRSYPSKRNKGKIGSRLQKVDRDAPGTGLGYDRDVMAQMQGDYKKPALRGEVQPAPMRVITTLYG